MVNEWWVARRGFAMGAIVASSGVSGVAFPFIVEALLNKYGYQITLRVITVAMAILTGPLIPFFKGRLPPSQQGAIARTDWSFIRKPLFWMYCMSNLAQGLGFYFPSLYLPSFASAIGLSPKSGALLVALMSISQVVGQFSFGYLSDGRLPLNLLAFISTIVAAIASFTLWGLARSLAPLIMFSLVYGVFGYGYAPMRARMGTAVSGDPSASLAVFSIFCFGQGVGNVLAGALGARLLSQTTNINSYGAMKYKALVIFTGGCILLSAVSICCWHLLPRRLRSI
jgi:MFS family permease